ncbi:MAG: nucleotidyltransferase domain-containing protein [Nitrospirota bacterium]
MAILNLTKYENQALDELIATLKADWPLARFIVFGSKVKGMADEESDIDILIILPCKVTGELRHHIIQKVFDVNLTYGSNISVLIVSEDEWERGNISILPIHAFIEEEGIPL